VETWPHVSERASFAPSALNGKTAGGGGAQVADRELALRAAEAGEGGAAIPGGGPVGGTRSACCQRALGRATARCASLTGGSAPSPRRERSRARHAPASERRCTRMARPCSNEHGLSAVSWLFARGSRARGMRR
jgi:hypothetical protein